MIEDATYQGRPLPLGAWVAHLELLRTVAAGGRPDLMNFDLAHHQAWVAIGQCGHVHDTSRPSSNGSFVWAEWALTPRGVEYLEGLSKSA